MAFAVTVAALVAPVQADALLLDCVYTSAGYPPNPNAAILGRHFIVDVNDQRAIIDNTDVNAVVLGYALTMPVVDSRSAPQIASVDEHNLVAISRFGDRMRVTATAEFAGYDTSHKPSDFAFMKRVAQSLYPDGADYDRAEMWAGLRPMTPTNLPFFGRRRLRNLFLNTGHGHIGWTMSHGSARITADLIAGRKPAIPMDGLVQSPT